MRGDSGGHALDRGADECRHHRRQDPGHGLGRPREAPCSADQFTLAPLGGASATATGAPAPDPRVPGELLWWERTRVALAAFPPPPADTPFLAAAGDLGLDAVDSPYVDPDPQPRPPRPRYGRFARLEDRRSRGGLHDPSDRRPRRPLRQSRLRGRLRVRRRRRRRRAAERGSSLRAEAAAGLEVGDDGSITILMQSEAPGPDREANWLPTPPVERFRL